MNSYIGYTIGTCVFIIIYIIGLRITYRERKIDKNMERIGLRTNISDSSEEEKENDGQNKGAIYDFYKKHYRDKFLQADLNLTYEEFNNIFTISVIVYFLAVASALFMKISILVILAFTAGLFFAVFKVPDLYIDSKKQKRLMALNEQKGDILTIMNSNSITGASMEKTFYDLSEKLESPAKEVFEKAYRMAKLNWEMERILDYLRTTFNSNDFNLLLNSYQLWLRNSKGNLQDTFALVSQAIRDKEEIDLEVKNMIIAARVYLYMLLGMIVMFCGLSALTIRDMFFEYIKHPIGQIGIVVSIVLFIFGATKINNLKNSVRY